MTIKETNFIIDLTRESRHPVVKFRLNDNRVQRITFRLKNNGREININKELGDIFTPVFECIFKDKTFKRDENKDNWIVQEDRNSGTYLFTYKLTKEVLNKSGIACYYFALETPEGLRISTPTLKMVIDCDFKEDGKPSDNYVSDFEKLKEEAGDIKRIIGDLDRTLQEVINNGGSITEVIAARENKDGKKFRNLKERLDVENSILKERLDVENNNLNSEIQKISNTLNKVSDKQTIDIKHFQQKIRMDNKAKLSKFLLPSNFSWQYAPIQIFTDGKSFKTYFDVAALKNTGGTTYYIKHDTGLNTNDGKSESAPFQTLGKALSVANDGDTIIILDTLLSRTNLGIANISVTKNINIIAKTKCVIKAGDTHTFTKTSGYTNVWETTRSASLRVVDYVKEYDFIRVNSIAECELSSGSWYTDGSKVYMHTLESVTPIDSKHFILINTGSFITVDSTIRNVKLYLENVDIVGGTPSVETKNSASTKSYLYVKNSKLLYNCATTQGSIYAAGCEHAFFQNVTCAYSWEDGFDYQPLNGTPTKFIEVDCIGHSNGRFNQAADNFNGSTAHQDCKGIRFGGYYYKNIGPNVVDIYGTIQSINFNVASFDSAATQIPKIGFEIMDNQMWLYNCTAFGNDIDVYYPTGNMYVDDNSVYYTKGGSGNFIPV